MRSSCDDAAWSILDPPRRLSVLLVTQGNAVLEAALKACPIARLDPCTPAGFDALDPDVFAARQPYDVIVLDNHVPAHLPPCRYLVFGAPRAESTSIRRRNWRISSLSIGARSILSCNT